MSGTITKARALLAEVETVGFASGERAIELLAALCDELEAANVRERDAVNARIETSHDLHIRLELAEAGAAAMRDVLGFGLGTVDVPECVANGSPCDGSCACNDVEWRLCACGGLAPCDDAECPTGRALASDAGRAMLDRLAVAESERDALRAEVQRTAAIRESWDAAQIAQRERIAEIDALRAELAALRGEA